MTINNKFEIGEIVYIKTDVEQFPCQVVELIVSKTNIMYVVSRNLDTFKFYDYELSDVADKNIKILYGG